jgi:pimeloyl-ACP methyl ester carboxylesterase
MEHCFLELPHVRLHAVTAGSGPLVVLLHGFPEFWYSWRQQIPALAAAGYRVIAPDLRGYNTSDKPAGVREYAMDRLVEDVVQLMERESKGPAFLVGHDWGGVIAWRCAALHPGLIRKLAILNAPHPTSYRRLLWRSPRQWLRSGYVGMFQFPWLPELVLRGGDYWLIERALRRQPGSNVFTEEDIAAYKEALRVPGALTSALNYYRAAVRHSRWLYTEPQQVALPTLLIWGERDPYLSSKLTRNLDSLVPHLRIERLATIGHWVQNEAARTVNALLLDHFAEAK